MKKLTAQEMVCAQPMGMDALTLRLFMISGKFPDSSIVYKIEYTCSNRSLTDYINKIDKESDE